MRTFHSVLTESLAIRIATWVLFYCVCTIYGNAQNYKTSVILIDGTTIIGQIGLLKDSSIVLYNHPPYAISEINLIKIRNKDALWARPISYGLIGGLTGAALNRNNYTPYTGPPQNSFYSGYSSTADINRNLEKKAMLRGLGIGMFTGAAIGIAVAFISKKVKINGDLHLYQKRNKRKLQKYVGR